MGRYVFKLPDVGEGTAEAELVEWKVKVGDQVEEDQPLADVMTDKATVELTSPVAGKVTATNGAPGEMLAVGSPFVEFEVEGAGNAAVVSSPPERGRGTAEGGGGGEPQAQVRENSQETEPDSGIASQPLAPTTASRSPSPADAGEELGGAGNYVFKLPDVGEGTAEAELVEWKVAVGDAVSEDQPLADVMTDKATVELTSPVAGVVVSLNGAPGQMLAVGSPFVRLQVEGKGNVSSSSPAERGRGTSEAGGGGEARKPSPQETPSPKPASSPEKPAAAAAPSTTPSARSPSPVNGGGPRPPVARVAGERPLASPAVRKRAHDLGVPLQFVPGSGPGGRVGHEDLDAYVANPPSPPGEGGRGAAGWGSAVQPRTGVTDVKIIGMRRRIAQQMQESKKHIPHITYVEEVDGTELDALRVYLNGAKRADQPKLTLLPFFIRAMVKVLPAHPQINARFDDEAGVLTQYDGVHVGIATQGPNGLLVPVVRHAETMGVFELAAEIGRVTGAAKDGSAKKEELTGSTITLTSLGTLGGVVHTPIINWPEVAIVGPNKLIERPVVRNGEIAVRKMMNISSSFDHRIVDGWDAATFVQKMKGLLEHPAALFVE